MVLAVLIGVLLYVLITMLLLRFVRFVTACDAEIRTMTRDRHAVRSISVFPRIRAKRSLRIGTVSP